MTEKRFIQPNEECRVIKNAKTGETAIYYDTEDGLMFLKWLNELHEENEQLKEILHFLQNDNAGDILNVLNTQQNEIVRLIEENEELKQRNDRQAKRLGELYELMAKKDWESLTEIIDDFCSCEEQLQRESGTYGGLE